MLNQEQTDYLSNLSKEHIHGKNILAKKQNENIENFYSPYINFISAINNDQGELSCAVKGLNTYKEIAKTSSFSAQSKFEPTIIEEFFCLLLKKCFGNDILQYGSINAYSSLYFNYGNIEEFRDNISITLNEKDQDVSIYRAVNLIIDDTKEKINIPIVSIECKTYLDKTMLESAVATATKIKQGNPNCLFLIATETYDVASSVEIDKNIDNIYILRKSKRKSKYNRNSLLSIQESVIQHLLYKIKEHLEIKSLSIDERVQKYGYLRI